MSKAEALGIGIILNGRGIMELVVANIALQRGFIDQKAFSALVFMGVFTTVITPILFKRLVLPRLAAAKRAGET
jgi:Kef-type K+ transport system membrane component KefB